MTKPEPLDCGLPFAVRFTTVTTDGKRSRTTSTIVSLPETTLMGAVVGIAEGAGLTCTRSSGARPMTTVAAAPPTTPPRITPRRRIAAPLGPDDRGAGAGDEIIREGYLRGRAAVSAPAATALRRRAVGRVTSGSTIWPMAVPRISRST